LMTTTLRRRGYRVQEAASGQEALALSKTSPFDLVISDWMMPEMDCLALCRHLRDIQTDDCLYFILLTSKNEKAEIATGLDAGADDFLVKPVNGTELDARIRAGARVVALHRAIVQKSDIANKALLELRPYTVRSNGTCAKPRCCNNHCYGLRMPRSDLRMCA
ncbi:MAG: sigma-B regulation protein RsbU (phosphoserine phosphatase), partial [Dinoroseobacter sp.]